MPLKRNGPGALQTRRLVIETHCGVFNRGSASLARGAVFADLCRPLWARMKGARGQQLSLAEVDGGGADTRGGRRYWGEGAGGGLTVLVSRARPHSFCGLPSGVEGPSRSGGKTG